jgi:hypothetical protein
MLDLEDTGATPAEIEAVVRRYLARVARRYAPLAVGLVVLLLVVTLVPTVSPKDQAASPLIGGAGGRGSAATTPGVAGAGVAGSPSASGSVAAGAPGALVSAGAELPTGITPPAPADSKGVARSGIACGPGVRQVPWSIYAPLCVPAYAGNNGATTSHGISASAITAVFRRTNSAEEKAAFAAVGDAAPGTDDQYLSDLRTYVDHFNNTFELYGRKLVVKDFNGQGDNLEEDQGRNLQGAQADAATARQLGGFMDLSSSPTLASTQPYEENLAHEKVIAIGAVGLPKSWMKKYAPYEYTIFPADGTKQAQAAIHAVCQRMWQLPAAFASNAAYTLKNRVFGLVTPENPVYTQYGDEVEKGIKAECGGVIAKRVSYSINVATMEQQSVGIVAQLNAANVSTVICVCDPVVEIFISHTADSQKYGPEWVATPWLDPQGRQLSQTQWAHAISIQGSWTDKAHDEAYKVFKMIKPNAEPAEQYYAEAYWTALYVFIALQNAGPDLNPLTFQQGVFGFVKSGPGQYGTWAGGPEAYSPAVDIHIGYWDPNAVSNFDGKKGGWFSCEGGTWLPFDDPAKWGPAHTQFHCFGK